MNPTIQIPQLPPLKPDGTFDTPALQRFFQDIQTTLRDKQLADYQSYKSVSNNLSAEYLLQKDIENLVVKWALIDPLSLDPMYQVCDGTVWKEGSYAKTYWESKGLYNIPNLLGYGVRAISKNKGVDPDCNDRRQAITGDVNTTSGVVITVSDYIIKAVKEAKDDSRTVIIGEPPATLFYTLTVYGTISTYDVTAKTVTLTSITGTFTAGSARNLILKGDVIGSFQSDEFKSHAHNIYGKNIEGTSGGSAGPIGNASGDFNRVLNYPTVVAGGSENRGKNIALLPIMCVNLSSTSNALISSGSNTPSYNFTVPPMLQAQHKVAYNVSSGTHTAGSWQNRPLNYLAYNNIPDSGIDTSTYQITLPSGEYEVEGLSMSFYTNRNRARLWNITDNVLILSGDTGDSNPADGYNNTGSNISGRFTLTKTTVIQLQHYAITTRATDGFGFSSTTDLMGDNIFADFRFWKIG